MKTLAVSFQSKWLGLIIVVLLAISFTGRCEAAPIIVGAQAVQQRTDISLPAGCDLYIFGFATGGVYDIGGFSSGSQKILTNANGGVAAGLAVSTTSQNSFSASGGWHSIAGFGASGFQYFKALYGENNSPGALSASVKFTLSGAPALVVVMGLGGGHQYLALQGPSELQQDAATPQKDAKPILIAHAYLGPGEYEISESTLVAEPTQAPG